MKLLTPIARARFSAWIRSSARHDSSRWPGDRPVQQVEVDVLEPEPRQAGVERAQRAVVALVVVPELGGHEDLLARDAAVPQAAPTSRSLP